MAIVEIFLGAFITALLEKMASGEWLKFVRDEGIHTQLKNWIYTLSKIPELLTDAEDKQLTNRAVNLWLDDLQDLAYDLDDLVDELSTEALRRNLMSEPAQATSSKQFFGCRMAMHDSIFLGFIIRFYFSVSSSTCVIYLESLMWRKRVT